MPKRKQPELATAYPDDVVSDFRSLMEDYYHLHPICKSLQIDNGKKIFDLLASFVPCRSRSVRVVRSDKKTALVDAGSVTKANSNPRGVKKKPKAETETSDCEVICMNPVSNRRVSRRLRGRTTKVRRGGDQERGKLDSAKFDIYIESIWNELSEEKKNEFAYLNALWFGLHSERGYKEKVLSWIKKQDIFSKKYVFVPIVKWGHWSLLILCHFGVNPEANSERRCMLLLDSLQTAHSKQLEPGIRRFVSDIFKTEERPENKEQIKKLPLLIPKVPQQQNGEECGFFVLYYIYQFLKSDPNNFIFSRRCTHFMNEDWFTPEDVECFVKTLESTIDCSELL